MKLAAVIIFFMLTAANQLTAYSTKDLLKKIPAPDVLYESPITRQDTVHGFMFESSSPAPATVPTEVNSPITASAANCISDEYISRSEKLHQNQNSNITKSNQAISDIKCDKPLKEKTPSTKGNKSYDTNQNDHIPVEIDIVKEVKEKLNTDTQKKEEISLNLQNEFIINADKEQIKSALVVKPAEKNVKSDTVQQKSSINNALIASEPTQITTVPTEATTTKRLLIIHNQPSEDEGNEDETDDEEDSDEILSDDEEEEGTDEDLVESTDEFITYINGINSELKKKKPIYARVKSLGEKLISKVPTSPLGNYAVALGIYHSKRPDLKKAQTYLNKALKSLTPPKGASSLKWKILFGRYKLIILGLFCLILIVISQIPKLMKKKKSKFEKDLENLKSDKSEQKSDK